ncbi:hypothetical protein VPH35_058042 [Triticum aestivum]
MQRCASYDDQRAEVQCSSSCMPELDVRPLHGHRNQGSLVAWPSCNWPRGQRICAGTRFLFCWIHPFVLLQPLSLFSTIPIRFLMNIWIFAGTGPVFAGTNWWICCKVDTTPEEAASSGKEGCGQRRSNAGSCNRVRWSYNRRLGELQEGWLFFAEQFSFFAGTDVLFCWNRDKFLLHWLQSSQTLLSFLLEPKFGFAGSVF